MGVIVCFERGSGCGGGRAIRHASRNQQLVNNYPGTRRPQKFLYYSFMTLGELRPGGGGVDTSVTTTKQQKRLQLTGEISREEN